MIVVARSAEAVPAEAHVIELARLDIDEASALFEAAAGSRDHLPDARQLMTHLAATPRAIRQVAAVVGQGRRSIADVRNAVMGRRDRSAPETDDRGATTRIVALAIAALGEQGEHAALATLEKLAVLGDAPIDPVVLRLNRGEMKTLADAQLVTSLGSTVDHAVEFVVDAATRDGLLRRMDAQAMSRAVRHAATRLRLALESGCARNVLDNGLRSHVESVVDVAIRTSDDVPADLLFRTGVLELEDGDAHCALRTFEHATRVAACLTDGRRRLELTARLYVAAARVELGEEEALEELGEVLTDQFDVFGGLSRDVVRAHYYYGRAHLSVGRFSLAKQMLADSVRVQRHVTGCGQRQLAETLYHAALASRADGDSATAKRMLHALLAEDTGVDRAGLLGRRAHFLYANILEDEQEFREALSEYVHCLALWWESERSRRSLPIAVARRDEGTDIVARTVGYHVDAPRSAKRLNLVDYRPDLIDLKVRISKNHARSGNFVDAYRWRAETMIIQELLHGYDAFGSHVARREVDEFYRMARSGADGEYNETGSNE